VIAAGADGAMKAALGIGSTAALIGGCSAGRTSLSNHTIAIRQSIIAVKRRILPPPHLLLVELCPLRMLLLSLRVPSGAATLGACERQIVPILARLHDLDAAERPYALIMLCQGGRILRRSDRDDAEVQALR
jgi:hypothetical protein